MCNIENRDRLKQYFKKGKLPDEKHFSTLIDSTFNKADDNLDINSKDGLRIFPAEDGKLISLYESVDADKAKWVLGNTKGEGLFFDESNKPQDENAGENVGSSLFLRTGGNIGLGTDQPDFKLDVRGISSSDGRAGNYKVGSVPANGKWHPVFDKPLSSYHAFEIMAFAQAEEGKGKYALMHAIAISTFGKSRSRIRRTRAHYGRWWNKIGCRWCSKGTKEYNLELRTFSNYGTDKSIRFRVGVLWDADFTSKTPENEGIS